MKMKPHVSLFLGLLALGLAGTAAGAGQVYVLDDEGSDAALLEEGAFLGVSLREETEHPEGGARVSDVVDGSPAEKAGLEEGDIVQRFEGQPIRGPVSLTERIHEKEPGDRVTLTILREGKQRQLEVELGEREAWGRGHKHLFGVPLDPERLEALGEWAERFNEEWGGSAGEGGEAVAPRAYYFGGSARPRLGVQLSETTPELRSHFGGTEEEGVLVSKVLEAMPAERAGFEVGDLIVAVDGEPVASAHDLMRAVRDKGAGPLKIEVVRDRQRRTIEVTIPEVERRERPSGPRAYLGHPHPRSAPVAVTPPPAPVAPAAPVPPRVRPLARWV